jgi:hypothetical protein
MSNYEHLDIASGIKVNVDTKGITNGTLDVTDIQYDTDGYIGQLNDWITNNNISIDMILDIVRGLDPTLIDILTEVKKTPQIDFNEVLQLINKSKLDLIKELYNRLKPIYVDRPVVYTTTKYIEIRTTKYIYTKDRELKGKEKVENINWGTTKPFNDDYLELTSNYRYKIDRLSRVYFKAYNKEYTIQDFLSKFGTRSIVDLIFEKGIIDVNKWKSLKTTFKT